MSIRSDAYSVPWAGAMLLPAHAPDRKTYSRLSVRFGLERQSMQSLQCEKVNLLICAAAWADWRRWQCVIIHTMAMAARKHMQSGWERCVGQFAASRQRLTMSIAGIRRIPAMPWRCCTVPGCILLLSASAALSACPTDLGVHDIQVSFIGRCTSWCCCQSRVSVTS